ncbi:unnamed protein product [Rhizoctonia solani]|uniref:Protein kinase domain-containing protein n=1 Tax=Rhizoctonia solani TaxID=456999 RepID=A0A8H3HL03_9AGAM|nr:unnamed protein product [Rhizoctonia solani]
MLQDYILDSKMEIFDQFSCTRTNRTKRLTIKQLSTRLGIAGSTYTFPSAMSVEQSKNSCQTDFETTGILLRLVMSPEQVFAGLAADPSEFTLDTNVENVSSAIGITNPTDDISPIMPTSQIITILGQHKCIDVTSSLESYDEVPFAGGGAGNVYRGIMGSGKSKRHVAIKCHRVVVGHKKGTVMLRDAAKELYTWSKCQHSNILPLLGLAQYRDQLAMVSPLIERGSLSSFLFESPKLDRLNACLQIGTGLAYLHGLNIVHGDLKAENALVANDGTIKLVDFGSSVIKNHSLRFSSGNGAPHFTLGWAAPEASTSTNRYRPTKMGDVYAFGMTILEVITGEAPFAEVLNKVMIPFQVNAGYRPGRPECCIPISDPGEVIWSLLKRCWNSDPTKRPSAIEARDIIRSVRIDRTTLQPGVHGNRERCVPMCHYTRTC